MISPFFHKSKTTTGILELCEKNGKWGFISTCSILPSEGKKMNQIKEYGFEPDLIQLFQRGEVGGSKEQNLFVNESLRFHDKSPRKNLSFKNADAVHYLRSIEPYIPEELISCQNYTQIKKLANHFNGGITSFFGFESRLNSPDARSDYLFAISSKRGEREIIADLIKNGQLPDSFIHQLEWQRVRDFIIEWADSNSILYDNVLGVWFEFDMDETTVKSPVPSIFLHTIPFKSNTLVDTQKCNWLIQQALPLIIGQPLSEKIEQRLLDCIQKLPGNANITQFGMMLSRAAQGIRIVVNRIQPKEILPYLESLGWSGGTSELSELLVDLDEQVTRFSINIDIMENGLGQKIGIECSYYPDHHDQYQLEPRWLTFFDYLVKKKLCLQEKRNCLINYLPEGKNQAEYQKYNQKPLIIATKISDDADTTVLVRQMGHVKIVYQPNRPLEAKGYFGARLFGNT
jgi:hypothetical protein